VYWVILRRPASPSFFSGGQRRHHHRHHLHDDGGGDVGHDAEREDRQPLQRAAREHVEHAQDGALLLLEEARQRDGVDAGHGNEGPDPVHHEGAQQEEQPLAQVAQSGGLAKGRSRIHARR
jgi:hypothetical protein